jgi:hypothetical protein
MSDSTRGWVSHFGGLLIDELDLVGEQLKRSIQILCEKIFRGRDSEAVQMRGVAVKISLCPWVTDLAHTAKNNRKVKIELE